MTVLQEAGDSIFNKNLPHQISVGLVVIPVKFNENVFSGYVGSTDFVLRI
jgi:hypothetical protein